MLRVFLLFVFLGLFAANANAQSASITIGEGFYTNPGPGLIGQNIYTNAEARGNNFGTAIGIWRTSHGSSSWPRGTVVQVTYTDGTSELFLIIAPATSTKQAKPVNGSQKDADGNVVSGACDSVDCVSPPSTDSGSGSEGGSGGSFWGSIWQWIIGFLNQPDPRGTVTVGGVKPV